jgi:hypothetical protein
LLVLLQEYYQNDGKIYNGRTYILGKAENESSDHKGLARYQTEPVQRLISVTERNSQRTDHQPLVVVPRRFAQ